MSKSKTKITNITNDDLPEKEIKTINIRDINADYIPVIIIFPKINDNIFTKNLEPKFSKNIDYPKFSFGFHHFVHQSKDKLEITKEFEGKKKVYYIINKFEITIDNYDLDIGNITKVYFDLDPKPNILDRSFFKLWEILQFFDLIPNDISNFISAHIGEKVGGFLQATMYYRNKFNKGNQKNDKYFTYFLDENEQFSDIRNNYINYFSKEKPQRIYLQEFKKNDDPTIMNINNINNFSKKFIDQGADFITADGSFNWKNKNVQEQEAFILILSEIITAVKIQAKGGNFVCRIFETFTETTVKLIIALNTFYEEIYIIKPLISRKANSEKYLVCKNFLFGDDKTKNNNIKSLENLLDNMINQDNFLVEIFPEFEIPKNFLVSLIKANTMISNRQFININEIVDFIQKQNYRGDVYQTRRQMQIDASKFWVDRFYPDVNDFEIKKKENDEFVKSVLEINNNLTNRLLNKLN
ncbi:FtsJ methyltransferase [uncultured virus]|nr:FtsJ methyltransferase [uncultured virus]